MRVLSVLGTRPEAVKMAPIVRALREAPGIESLVCVTAQHREMLDQVLELFEIVPDVDLDLMQPDQSLAEITAEIFEHLDRAFRARAEIVGNDQYDALAGHGGQFVVR